MRREMADEEAWILGAYVHNACAVAFTNVMSAALGKHSAGPQAKYLEHPFSWRPPELTEEEKIERTETLFKALGSLKDAFEANHPKLDDNSAVG